MNSEISNSNHKDTKIIVIKNLINKTNELIDKSNLIFLTKNDNESMIENIYMIKLYELLFELYLKDSNYKNAFDIAKKFLLKIYKYE